MCLDIDLRDNLEKRVLEAKDGITRWEVFKALADNRQSKKHPFYFEEVSSLIEVYYFNSALVLLKPIAFVPIFFCAIL